MAVPDLKAQDTSAKRAFGLIRIGTLVVALPVEAVREVIPCPQTLDPFPRARRDLLGAVKLRGAVIPVFDLSEVLGADAASRGERDIVVLRTGSRLLGLVISGVVDVVDVDPADLRGVATAGAGPNALTTHTFQHGDSVVAVLDEARIVSMPDIPTVAEVVEQTNRNALGTDTPVLLMRCGKVNFGVPASMVAATTARQTIAPSPLSSRLCLGVVVHHGMEVPVVDICDMLGVASENYAGEAGVVVLRFPEGRMLGIACNDVTDIARPTKGQIARMPPGTISHVELFEGVLPSRGGRPYLVFAADKLAAHPPLALLATFSQMRAAHEQTRAARGAASGLEPYLLYLADGEQATALSQIAEILPYPDEIMPLDVSRAGSIGLFQHRDLVIPLYCLGTVTRGRVQLDPRTARVLIVNSGGRCGGFAVEGLCAIEHGRPASRSERATSATFMGALQTGTVEMQINGQARLIAKVDLFELLDACSCEPTRAAPTKTAA
jgi:purine-binding chemotaxis protein CheW